MGLLTKTNEKTPEFDRSMKLYAIKDRHTGFTPPIPMENDEYAKRYFKTQVLENPTIKNTPEDFSLWIIGEYNLKTGQLNQNQNLFQLIEKGETYVSM